MTCALVITLTTLLAAAVCPPAQGPVEGPVVRTFAPAGAYAGHWGADLAVPLGTPVVAVAGGVVTFAGTVAGRLSVTVHHGGGVRTSYSYLSALSVSPGAAVSSGAILGASGADHGLEALHLSLRVGDTYVDPLRWLACRVAAPAVANRLLPVLGSYPSARAPRHPGRHLRPSSSRPSGGRRGRLS